MKVFTGNQLEKYAELLVWSLELSRKRSGGELKKGDIISLAYHLPALDLAEIVYAKLLEKGCNVLCDSLSTPNMERAFYDKTDDEQLEFVFPWSEKKVSEYNGRVVIMAPVSLDHLKDIDPKRIATRTKKVKFLRDIVKKREAKGLYGWTMCVYPTSALAKKAKMTLRDYTEQVVRACYLDKDDPTAVWKKFKEEQEKIIDKLNRSLQEIDYFHVESEFMDLKVYPGEKRKFLGFDGCNMPSFEIFISPDCRKTEGVFYANEPSMRNGNIVKGVRLYFKKGRVYKATAKRGQKFLLSQLDTDKGARQLGEFALVDKRHSNITMPMASTLFDENRGGSNGSCHIAIGYSYSETYDGDPDKLTKEKKTKLGFNQSALHWDLVNTERSKVTAVTKGGYDFETYNDGEWLDFKV